MKIFFQILIAQAQTTDLFNPLGWVNVQRPGDLVVKVFGAFAGLIAVISIAFVVFNGFKLIIASNEEAITKAKEGLKWSVGGFVVGMLSFTVISGASKFLGFAPIAPGSDVIENSVVGPEQPGDFVSVLLFVMRNFLGIVGFATILMLIYYGFKYITAAGNEEAIEQAKTGLKWSILGFAVTLLAFTIVTGVSRFLLTGV